eukprot:GHVU01080809.1.p1 GENE.GHVU01080809.1~~GHVU01080809.1.p1  ORF type:complete len:212 (-),score=14.96 GHVU01080809.1:249-884(-)
MEIEWNPRTDYLTPDAQTLGKQEIPDKSEGTGTSTHHEVGVQDSITSTARLDINAPVPSLQNNDGGPTETVTPARVPREQILCGDTSHSRGTYPLPYGWDRDRKKDIDTRGYPGRPEEALYDIIPWEVAFPRGPELYTKGSPYNGEQQPEADGPTGSASEQCSSITGLKNWGLGERQRLRRSEHSPEMQEKACEMSLQSACTSRRPICDTA